MIQLALEGIAGKNFSAADQGNDCEGIASEGEKPQAETDAGGHENLEDEFGEFEDGAGDFEEESKAFEDELLMDTSLNLAKDEKERMAKELSKALRTARRNFGRLELVYVESSDGTRVRIIL